MMDLPTREARFARVGRLDLPEALREDVLGLIDAMEATQTGTAATATGPERATAPRPANVSSRPVMRKRL